MEKVVLAMDLGGTNLRLGVVDRQGTLLESSSATLSGDKSPDTVSKSIFRGIEDLISHCDGKGLPLEGISLSAAGIISSDEGKIVFSPNLPGWKEVPLREMIAHRFGLPTILENDGNAAAYGEFWKGSGRDYKHLVMFALGTGVGGGVVSNGLILRGSEGMAAELGHLTVVAEGGRACKCGNMGCLEEYSSATAIVDMIEEEWRGEKEPPGTAEEACLLARGGQELCLRIFRRAGFFLGVAMAGVVHIFNPDVIVIGGGVVGAWDLFMPSALAEMSSRAFPYTDLARRVSVHKAELGSSAGLIGAAGLFWREGC
jgi:glucokinase